MHELLLAFTEGGSDVGLALPEALRISGIALLAIFFVMGLFGAMITLLSVIFPESEVGSK
jgi:hypothetical protein